MSGFKNNDVEISGDIRPNPENAPQASGSGANPGAARGSRQKFKDRIEEGNDKKTVVPKSYSNAKAPKSLRGSAANDYASIECKSNVPPHPSAERDNKPS